MADRLSPQARNRNMSKIKSTNTAPEMAVRSMVHRLGYRFRLHVKDLPGKPDIVLSKHRKVIFVHGCFWHGHKGCKRASRPSTNTDFWNTKIDSNIARDRRVRKELNKLGWKSLVVWQCQLKKPDVLKRRIVRFLNEKGKE